MDDERAFARELGLVIALLAATALVAPVSATAGAAIGLVLAAVLALIPAGARARLAGDLGRYHAPPLARACDCLLAAARHGAAWVARRRATDLVDLLSALAFFALIAAAIALLEADKHEPNLRGSAAGLALGIVAWHLVLEVVHAPQRLAHYRGGEEARPLPARVYALILVAELAAFVVLELDHSLPGPFARGLLAGISAMGLADFAALQSTLIAVLTGGRPLR